MSRGRPESISPVRRARSIFVPVVAIGLALLGGCGGDDEELPARDLIIATGRDGGVYREYGLGLEKMIDDHLPKLRAHARQTASSVENVELLAAGMADVGFTRADSASSKGDAARSIVALAWLYDSYVQIVVRRDSDIRTIDDLRRRCRPGPPGSRRCAIGIGPKGSGTRLVALRVLAAAGIRWRDTVRRSDLDISEEAEALARGRVDAIFWAGGLPTPAVKAIIDAGTPVRFVALGDVADRVQRRHPDEYTSAPLPARAYGTAGNVSTLRVSNFLVARRELPDEIAYRLTEALFAHRAELADAHPEATYLDRAAAIDTQPLDLHPGATRYYADAAR